MLVFVGGGLCVCVCVSVCVCVWGGVCVCVCVCGGGVAVHKGRQCACSPPGRRLAQAALGRAASVRVGLVVVVVVENAVCQAPLRGGGGNEHTGACGAEGGPNACISAHDYHWERGL